MANQKKQGWENNSSLFDSTTAKTIGIMCVGAVGDIGLVTVALPTLGFTAVGISGGSIAAAVQFGIGSIASGSMFATLQSAGVVGLSTCTQAIIGAAVAGGMAKRILTKKNRNGRKIFVKWQRIKHIEYWSSI